MRGGRGAFLRTRHRVTADLLDLGGPRRPAALGRFVAHRRGDGVELGPGRPAGEPAVLAQRHPSGHLAPGGRCDRRVQSSGDLGSGVVREDRRVLQRQQVLGQVGGRRFRRSRQRRARQHHRGHAQHRRQHRNGSSRPASNSSFEQCGIPPRISLFTANREGLRSGRPQGSDWETPPWQSRTAPPGPRCEPSVPRVRRQGGARPSVNESIAVLGRRTVVVDRLVKRMFCRVLRGGRSSIPRRGRLLSRVPRTGIPHSTVGCVGGFRTPADVR